MSPEGDTIARGVHDGIVRERMDAADLVGRDIELGRLRAAIAPGRLVVVSGPPGIGKTALLRAALRGRERVVWAELDGARSEAHLWSALGSVLGVTLQSLEGAPTQLAWALRDVAVVVLDGADLLDPPAWARLDALREARPEVAWLVGAIVERAGSASLKLAPLPVGDARRLLVERAAARGLERAVDPTDPAFDTLAERLDGLPLALELAAGRLSLMSPRELVDRLDSAVVRGDDRRTSVEGALRFAWDLLGPAERDALAILAPLRSFSIEIAVGLLGNDAFGLLERLRARSVVTVRGDRLAVLEGLRPLALRQLDDPRRATFVSYWSRYAIDVRAAIRGTRQVEATHELRAEQPNLRAALALAHGHPAEAVSIAVGLLITVRTHGPLWSLDELPDVAALARAAPGPDAANLLTYGVGVLTQLGRMQRAREWIELSLAMPDPLGTSRSSAWSELGWIEVVSGNRDAARRAFDEALATALDGNTAALALNRLSTVELHSQDIPAAIRALEEALVRLDGAFSPRMRGAVCLNLGIMRAIEGRRVEAEDLLMNAARELAPVELMGEAAALRCLGYVRLGYGDVPGAADALKRAWDLDERYGSELSLGLVAAARALERWLDGDRAGAREWFAVAADRQRVDPVASATTRAFRAALAADDGQRGTLDVELAAARAVGTDPRLLDILAAFGGAPVPPPADPDLIEHQIARRLVARSAPGVRFDRGGRWFERGGKRVDLARRGAMRRVLGALVEARLDRPGEGLSVQEVFAAGWPDERAHPDAASARVYTAVRELRALGLGELLKRESEGYLLDPAIPIQSDAV